jgi:hypothetical protein
MCSRVPSDYEWILQTERCRWGGWRCRSFVPWCAYRLNWFPALQRRDSSGRPISLREESLTVLRIELGLCLLTPSARSEGRTLVQVHAAQSLPASATCVESGRRFAEQKPRLVLTSKSVKLLLTNPAFPNHAFSRCFVAACRQSPHCKATLPPAQRVCPASTPLISDFLLLKMPQQQFQPLPVRSSP